MSAGEITEDYDTEITILSVIKQRQLLAGYLVTSSVMCYLDLFVCRVCGVWVRVLGEWRGNRDSVCGFGWMDRDVDVTRVSLWVGMLVCEFGCYDKKVTNNSGGNEVTHN
jgi:hypothetical protein